MTPHAARCLRSVLVALACFAVSAFAWADVFRPAYLELRELGGDRYDVLLKVPAQGDDLRLSIDVRFPSGTVEVEPRRSQFLTDSHMQRWRVERPGGLVDTSIEIFGRAAGVTEVLARVERLDGTTQVDSCRPAAPPSSSSRRSGSANGRHVSPARCRAHSRRHRPSAVRAVAAADRARLQAHRRDDHGIHARA